MDDGSSAREPGRPLPTVRCFVLIVGNARSGSTLLGSILDGHPRAVVASESAASATFWRGMSGADILRDVVHNATQAAAEGRLSEGYRYQIGPSPESKHDVLLAGDKTWNPALLLLHGNPGLLPSLEERLGMPVRLVHAIRNPFDSIATMHRRSGASIADRIRWYFMHCEAAAALEGRLAAERFLESHHASLLTDPEGELRRLCDFLDLPPDAAHLEAVRGMLFARPRRPATEIEWEARDLAEITARMADFPFLDRYREERPAAADRPG